MYHLTLTAGAAVGAFSAHRAFQPSTLAEHRVWIDAERVFLDKDAPLIKVTETKFTQNGQDMIARAYDPAFPEPRATVLENSVGDYLKNAVNTALADKKTFGPGENQTKSSFGVEAYDAFDKAEKRDTPSKPESKDDAKITPIKGGKAK